MHLLAVIDKSRQMQEGMALADVLAGIQDTGIQLTEIVTPPTSPLEDPRGLASLSPLTAPMPVNWFQRSRVCNGLLREIGRPLPDVVLSLGTAASTLAIDLAAALDCPLLVECWLGSHVRRPPVRSALASGYVTASSGLATSLRERNQHELIITAPYPVHMPEAAQDQPGLAPSVAVLDATSDAKGARIILDGLRGVVDEIPDLHICLELGGSNGDPIWKHAEAIGLLDRISSVSNASSLGPLVSECTLTLLASAACSARSIVDLAMARGRVVVQADHPLLSEAERTHQCILLESSPANWTRTIVDLLRDPDRRSRLGQAARAHVERRNDPHVVYSTWTQLLLEVSKDITYPFANTGSSSKNRG
ncbi:MAG: hypothetical protein VX527_04815 [Planctomycetota bacterium]|nr:hypothetical protein [Planctomycetota bacterium]